MYVINASTVEEAIMRGCSLIKSDAIRIPSRNGDTLEVPFPVATVYHKPRNRVIDDKRRNANPFFHFFEALWILQGRQDVKFLTEFNPRMADFSDDGLVFNAPYGSRMRHHHCLEGEMDQIEVAIQTLKDNPESRQVVLQIWDPVDLLNKKTKDKACNLTVLFRKRNGVLDMIVYNRSNDMLWGTYGANVVQFSTLHEYISAHVNIPMGTYTQVSNSFHVYLDEAGGKLWDKMKGMTLYSNPCYRGGTDIISMCHEDMNDFDDDLACFFMAYDMEGITGAMLTNVSLRCQSEYFTQLVLPMLRLYHQYKEHGPEMAIKQISNVRSGDWASAAKGWFENRIEGKAK